jgi:uncharacterized protein
MSEETVLALERWVEHRLPQTTKDLSVWFYGGEPLLEPDICHHFCRFFAELAVRRDVNLNLQLITNGVLASAETITDLAEAGLGGLKVTLDGWGPFHDAKRPFADGRGTYEKIVSNLLEIHGLVKIHVGGNFDAGNVGSIDRMIRDLEDRGLLPHVASLRFKPILGRPGGRHSSACAVSCISDTDLGAFVALKKTLIERGFGGEEVLELGPCSAYHAHTYVVAPDGDIYRCAAFVGRKQFVVGNVHHQDAPVTGMKPRSLSRCLSCRYLPACGGGCAYAAFLSKGDEGKVACEARYFVRAAKELVRAQARSLE